VEAFIARMVRPIAPKTDAVSKPPADNAADKSTSERPRQ
jgi:hypothetical protein